MRIRMLKVWPVVAMILPLGLRLMAASSDDYVHSLFQIHLSSAEEANLIFIESIDPQPESRIYHSAWVQDNSGRYVAVPDTSTISMMATNENISAPEAAILADLFATSDEIDRIEGDSSQDETRYHGVLEMPDGARKEELLKFQRTINAKLDQKRKPQLEMLISQAMADYNKLFKSLGKSKTTALFGDVADRSNKAMFQQEEKIQSQEEKYNH